MKNENRNEDGNEMQYRVVLRNLTHPYVMHVLLQRSCDIACIMLRILTYPLVNSAHASLEYTASQVT